MVSTSKEASVIVKSRFVLPGSQTFKDYIDYVDRNNAKRESIKENNVDFMNYQDYMGNQEKTTSLFTNQFDWLNEEQKAKLKRTFSIAQKNESILWQDVISFDNKWLEEHGVYNSKSHSIDEKKLKEVARLSMKEMLKREGLDKSSVWSGAIHYNTDNIHIHIATVEPSPTRERGKRKLKSIESMKSKVINNIMDRSADLKIINDLIRNQMVDCKKTDNTLSFKNRKFKTDFFEIYHSLPKDRKQWSYGYNSLDNVRPLIDKLSRDYIEKHHKEDYQKLINKLDKETEVLKKTYGASDDKRYADFKKNKVDELYKRMGNAFLQEMKKYDKDLKSNPNLPLTLKTKRQVLKDNLGFRQLKYGIDRMLNSEYKNWKNQMAYEQLQQQIDRER
ncbi:MobP2 family relaxase [Fictibacillus enclensis]|uniref:MobP2 family relaxase n=1 Tax=Fictibacillus enclensis TaxID=1017270 RepID=UPI00259FED08|nr:MobP2 family relaxase [Fictibacillus enclensis]MDM5196509.1 MobP2 family relaxase [Fictibacillus enclensis]